MKLSINRMTTTGQSLFAAAILTWVTGCAAPEVKPPSEKELDLMAGAVLAEAVYTETLLAECAAINSSLKSHAQDLRDMWMYTHEDVLSGADSQYTQALKEESTLYQEQPIALRAVRFTHRHENRAAAELRLRERGAANQRIVCERRFNELETTLTEKPYLDPTSERDAMIHEQLIEASEQPVTMDEVPTLAGNIQRNLEPGRSYRELEQRIEQQPQNQCPDPVLVVIHNNWPHEAYGVYCGDQTPYLVTCEWGECDAP